MWFLARSPLARAIGTRSFHSICRLRNTEFFRGATVTLAFSVVGDVKVACEWQNARLTTMLGCLCSTHVQTVAAIILGVYFLSGSSRDRKQSLTLQRLGMTYSLHRRP